MPDRTGSVERIALELGNALAEVQRLLSPEEALRTIAEFGVDFPPDLLAHPGFAAARSATVTAAEDLDAAMRDLVAAIGSEEALQIVVQGARTLEEAARVTGSFADLRAQLLIAGPTMPGVTPAQVAELTNELPSKLFDFLVVEQLDAVRAVGASLTVLGLIERTYHPADPANPTSKAYETARLRFDRLGALLTDPAQHFMDLYDWGDAAFDGDELLRAVDRLVAGMGLPSRFEPASGGRPARAEAFAIGLTAAPPGLDVDLLLSVGGGIDRDIALPHPAWTGHVKATAAAAAGGGGTIRPPLEITLRPVSGEIRGEVDLNVLGRPAEPFVLIGVAGGSRLEIGQVDVGMGFDVAWNEAAGEARLAPRVAGEIRLGKLVIDTSQADGFISKLLSGFGLESTFDAGMTWSSETGVRFEGSSTIEIALPVHVEIGPIKVPAMYVSLGFRNGAFPLELSADMSAGLGPLTAVASRIGASAELSFPPGGGNLGPAQLGFAFKPPSGVGLAIDLAEVSGGGFLRADPETGEYVGALELEFAEFLTLKAIGLISTRMPGGAPGFSLLIVVTAEFPGGLQLGYGFKLLAVGGLIGLERTMREQALLDGVRSGALESIMFPRDVVANAPRILSDLKAFFPPQAGHFLIAPMAKLAWGTPTLITASVGVIIEIPGNVALIGVLKVVLPSEQAAVLRLQVNFAGFIDFDGQRAHLFAALFDSRVLTTPIAGEMGVLARWGDDPNLVLTVGGFHPAFTPPPLPFPTPRRVSLDILNRTNARLQVSGYFAVTSNTVQFGAHADLFFKFSAFQVEGDVGFDALFRFSPFEFQIDVSASVSLKAFGVGCFSISLRFALEGPTPWRAHGRGSVSLFFFDISADFDLTWGEERDTTLPPIDVLPLVAAELSKLEGWETRSPARKTLVSLRRLPATEDQLVLHPTGTLFVRQRAVPLDLTLDRIGSQRPRDVNRVGVDIAGGGLVKRADTGEMFAAAQFKDMDDAAKLSRPAFERQHGGLELSPDGTALASARAVCRSARYEQIVFDAAFRRRARRFTPYATTLFHHLMAGNSVSRSPLSRARRTQTQPFADTIGLAGDSFTVAHTRDNTAAAPAFASDAAARDVLARRLAEEPELAGSLHVIPTAEVRG